MSDYAYVDSTDCGFHVAAYERLRCNVTDPDMTPLRSGLAVLINRGVLAWMRAFEAPEKQPRQPPGAQTPAPDDAVLDAWADMIRPHLDRLNKLEAAS